MTGRVVSAEARDAFADGRASFVPGLKPDDAVALPVGDALDLLRARLGDRVVDLALSPETTDPAVPAGDLPAELRGPRVGEPDGSWLRRSNMVGVNVRTIHSFFNVVKYALTLPASLDAIHLLPIWEPGVVMSLYGPASWRINDEFAGTELPTLAPHLDTPERQLRATVNLLHALGMSVGMDVIPHTDRFSEAVMAQPRHFEWLRREGSEIVDHREHLHEEVERSVLGWLAAEGDATADPGLARDPEGFFGPDVAEERRLGVLFGPPEDRRRRTDRRVDLVRHVRREGFEPVPATMGVPFRGLAVDPDPAAVVVDRHGLEWRDYVITRPEAMSRVFGPLARYKLYGRLDDNRDWAIDFDRPRPEVWDYVSGHYLDVQRSYGFDFMRGDMSHVQMRPDGVPDVVDRYYDVLGTVKEDIRSAGAPHFGYFAETFLPPRDVFGYGEELDHLEASRADATLGDLQSTVTGSRAFMERFRIYLDELAVRTCAPAFTVMTADKDDPRFDEFYVAGNEARAFTATFLTDMPSYVGLGFEVRDVHHEPVENERYTKLFVFHELGESNVYPSKARTGEYVWGRNDRLFEAITDLRRYGDEVLEGIAALPVRWLIAPDPTADRPVVAWTHDPPSLVFVVNFSASRDWPYFGIPGLRDVGGPGVRLVSEFSLPADVPDDQRVAHWNGHQFTVRGLPAGGVRAYRITSAAPSSS
ncbi:MAG: hypothetical protein R3290_03535 [Acidimicrobiia bacterium]|nr:hypothetical protein [Acidimicrobiia bacterium]